MPQHPGSVHNPTGRMGALAGVAQETGLPLPGGGAAQQAAPASAASQLAEVAPRQTNGNGGAPRLDFGDLIEEYVNFVRQSAGDPDSIRQAQQEMREAIQERVRNFQDQLRAWVSGRRTAAEDRVGQVSEGLADVTGQAAQAADPAQQVAQQALQRGQQAVSQARTQQGGGQRQVPNLRRMARGQDDASDRLSGIQEHFDRIQRTPGGRRAL